MDQRVLLDRLLGSLSSDAGCDASGDRLDVYVEAEEAGKPVARLFPDIAGHLRSCPDCREDYEALVALVRQPLDGRPWLSLG
jgi:hypothetical protein